MSLSKDEVWNRQLFLSHDESQQYSTIFVRRFQNLLCSVLDNNQSVFKRDDFHSLRVSFEISFDFQSLNFLFNCKTEISFCFVKHLYKIEQKSVARKSFLYKLRISFEKDDSWINWQIKKINVRIVLINSFLENLLFLRYLTFMFPIDQPAYWIFRFNISVVQISYINRRQF